ncbi:hypothetical protein HOP50_03g25970 [Chloropicon primus]|uniref:Uncharacterized protein n=1 Tax=Chloropicon primus TaxID=1764295 RepID=A0A5B8MHG3_9CHLO|nr:hypothetical protein A3770_03p25960 [Chloropicon primus]UPQ99290.1 hypothetical protein HOP50_03g25970 [Chloropicon primus]|mmetsp:Transcript_6486/g.19179  ORF Transcript_6486/g.19179 Transcript_6486/m.19179 type:complete len:266 (-) Transcript_6486:1697-2494(-)|eukprot:QDZ20078.1 hypothetical protein A3770_03p25960 [Chloropicon primus]
MATTVSLRKNFKASGKATGASARCPVRSGRVANAPRSPARRAVLEPESTVQYVDDPGTAGSGSELFSVVDEEKTLAASAFPIRPDELIRLTKEFLVLNNGCDKPEILADDFTFAGPVVGPIGKAGFLQAFSGFQVGDAFPDMKANAYNFHVDPFEGNRVWFSTRAVGTHTGVLAGSIQPTGKKVYSPPQASSVTFNEQGQATQLTAGYVMDRNVGNTDGLGGVFGLMWAVGKSPFKFFPEGRPWKPSLRYRLFIFISGFFAKLKK